MNYREVKMIDLDEMHVVVANGFGADPEYEAWNAILEFAEERQLDPWDQTHRFFGFNNPDPVPDSIEYGYEQWMTVSPDVPVAPPLETRDVDGGKYAMVRIHGLETIGASWQYLADWCEEHGYVVDTGRVPCLEELLTPIEYPPSRWDMNLYLALAN